MTEAARVRSNASESPYSLIEFMRDFPDHAACLDWLWRNRYAPDGHHAGAHQHAVGTEPAVCLHHSVDGDL